MPFLDAMRVTLALLCCRSCGNAASWKPMTSLDGLFERNISIRPIIVSVLRTLQPANKRRSHSPRLSYFYLAC